MENKRVKPWSSVRETLAFLSRRAATHAAERPRTAKWSGVRPCASCTLTLMRTLLCSSPVPRCRLVRWCVGSVAIMRSASPSSA